MSDFKGNEAGNKLQLFGVMASNYLTLQLQFFYNHPLIELNYLGRKLNRIICSERQAYQPLPQTLTFINCTDQQIRALCQVTFVKKIRLQLKALCRQL